MFLNCELNWFRVVTVIILGCILFPTHVTSQQQQQYRQPPFVNPPPVPKSRWSITDAFSIYSGSWADKVLQPFRDLMGTRAYDPWRFFLPVKRSDRNQRMLTEIPKEFDSRSRWPNCPTIGEIFEQGKCGSCWAVVPTDVMSDRICIKTNGKLVVRLSAGNLLSCCSTCGHGCKGGFPGGAWLYWKKHGIVTGASYSSNYGCQRYQFKSCYRTQGFVPPTNFCPRGDQTELQCRKTCQSAYRDKSYEQDLFYADSIYRVPNDMEAIQMEIMQNGPVQANLRVYEDFLYYKKGVYIHKEGKGLEYHAVKILGWGVENDGTPFWTVSNPWSKRWGNGGFFKILRGYNHAEIESHIMAGIPLLNQYPHLVAGPIIKGNLSQPWINELSNFL